MEKKLNFVNNRSETQRGIQLPDGRIISIYDDNNEFYLCFDKKINLENGTYDDSVMVGIDDHETPCLNNFIRNGAKEVSCNDEVTYFEDVFPDEFKLTLSKVRKIQKFFAEKGYRVTKEAILHQLSSWMGDLKSGYRDERRGYFLFTPCGHNPLSITLTTLNDLCSDWQHTYEC